MKLKIPRYLEYINDDDYMFLNKYHICLYKSVCYINVHLLTLNSIIYTELSDSIKTSILFNIYDLIPKKYKIGINNNLSLIQQKGYCRINSEFLELSNRKIFEN